MQRVEIDRKLTRWPKQLHQRILVCFPAAVAGQPDDQLLLEALGNEIRPRLERIVLAYIALHGKYPTPEAANRLEAVLSVHGAVQCLHLMIEIEPKKTGRRRRAVLAQGDLIDVSRFVEEFVQSGIPRVVAAVLRSESFRDAKAFVWDDGAPCEIERIAPGAGGALLRFSKANWGRPHNRSKFFGRLHNWLAQYRLALLLVSAASGLARRLLLRRVFASRKPKQVMVFSNAQLLLPEVPTSGVSRATALALEALPTTSATLIVHDLLPLSRPEFFEDAAVVNHVYLARLATKCKNLVVATPIIEAELKSIAQLLDTRLQKTHQLMLPVPRLLAVDEIRPRNSEPYFVFMGGFDPRKGLQQLVDHLGGSREASLGFRVVVVGSPNASSFQQRLAARLRGTGSIFEVQKQVTDESLAALISHSAGVLYPSFAEGYGLPILEAVSLGIPVLVRDTPTNEWLAKKFAGIDTSYSESDPNLISKLQHWAAAAHNVKDRQPAGIALSEEEWAQELKRIIDSSATETKVKSA